LNPYWRYFAIHRSGITIGPWDKPPSALEQLKSAEYITRRMVLPLVPSILCWFHWLSTGRKGDDDGLYTNLFSPTRSRSRSPWWYMSDMVNH
jgi:hypothetical protein